MEKKEEELVGVKEIARLAKVSIATVDRVLHNRTGVSVKTKEKIQQIIKELNYQPNIVARTLASRKKLRFAVIIPAVSLETAFWQAPLNGIVQAESAFRQYGIVVEKFLFDQNDRKSFIEQAKLLLRKEFDGVLLAPMFVEESIQFVGQCQLRLIPVVNINSDLPGQDGLAYIGPDLYQSGYLSAHLISYLVKPDESILLVNISRELDNDHHLMRKEEGFRAYWQKKKAVNEIIKTDIQQTDLPAIKKQLSKHLKNSSIRAVFVTNSRVAAVAKVLEELERTDLLLIGFDFLEDSIAYLKKGVIDFLICQKPQEQGYLGMKALYDKLVLHQEIQKNQFMPIDIITRENYVFYNN
ncbi:substrate-binding domain-containing protein [Flavihumibacter sp. UBA7668]|uniref:LacI family DNA-binding transcriptional regulator n=1 Tax=Flavihumibacter sp. UBA7668 TaxID=1946542 RepID=UPI0025C4D27F|nr:substrate-binding domain-containing protein [Flavihumibacter sp. UBA7668]